VCLYALVYGQPQRKELEAHINLRYIHEIKLTSAKNFVLWCHKVTMNTVLTVRGVTVHKRTIEQGMRQEEACPVDALEAKDMTCACNDDVFSCSHSP